MRYLECDGTAFEVGRQQGAALQEVIQRRWDEDVRPLLDGLRVKHPDIDSVIANVHERCLPYLTALAPEIVDEIRGISEGAAISFERALLLSTYNSTAMILGAPEFALDHPAAGNGCTALAFSASPVGPFLFKTYDPFGSKEIDSAEKRRAKAEREHRWLYVLRAAYGSGVAVLGVRLAGSIWTECGVNNHGLAFSSASLHPRLYPQTAHALPQHMLGTLAITRCKTTAEVRQLLATVPVFGKGFAMAFGDAGGDCVGVEKTAAFTGFNPPENGVAFQTNHLRAAEMVERGKQQDPAFWQNSYHRNSKNRAQRIRQQAAQWKQETRFESLVNALFHAGAEGDLIQNCTEQNQYWITTWGALLFPRTRQLWVAEGLPEEKQFQKWSL